MTGSKVKTPPVQPAPPPTVSRSQEERALNDQRERSAGGSLSTLLSTREKKRSLLSDLFGDSSLGS